MQAPANESSLGPAYGFALTIEFSAYENGAFGRFEVIKISASCRPRNNQETRLFERLAASGRPMPRFFFDLNLDHDTHGVELPDLLSAWREALNTCGEMVLEIDSEFSQRKFLEVTVRDEAGVLRRHYRGADD